MLFTALIGPLIFANLSQNLGGACAPASIPGHFSHHVHLLPSLRFTLTSFSPTRPVKPTASLCKSTHVIGSFVTQRIHKIFNWAGVSMGHPTSSPP
ncbi:hypothetical protein FB451DRAFT_1395625 [Mycena latifolia]|nr:hypothetical protein FB451DRAFT_1395625 [Mycena latifolia]